VGGGGVGANTTDLPSRCTSSYFVKIDNRVALGGLAATLVFALVTESEAGAFVVDACSIGNMFRPATSGVPVRVSMTAFVGERGAQSARDTQLHRGQQSTPR
jgi:hypothetical protein